MNTYINGDKFNQNQMLSRTMAVLQCYYKQSETLNNKIVNTLNTNV